MLSDSGVVGSDLVLEVVNTSGRINMILAELLLEQVILIVANEI